MTTRKQPERYWIGSDPTACDICGNGFPADVFIDGKTVSGQWGIMCEACHTLHGVGLGEGKGQEYTCKPETATELHPRGRWLKTFG